MKELYLIGCLLLATGVIFTAVSIIRYNYQETTEVPADIGWVKAPEDEEFEEPSFTRDTAVIYERNVFDPGRGKEPPEDPVDEVEEVGKPQGSYSFELRGINIVGDKKVAMLTAAPVRSISTRGRRPPRSPRPTSSSASKVHLVAEGEEIHDTGHKVASINSDKVIVTDDKGKEMAPLVFSLASDESLKRFETSYTEELNRQQRQSASQPATTPDEKRDKRVSRESPKETDTTTRQELERRKRGENLKKEMERLKRLRDKD